jgi:hypothetical protein
VLSDEHCPQKVKSLGPVTELITNKPSFSTYGNWCLLIGFIMQVPLAVMAISGTARAKPIERTEIIEIIERMVLIQQNPGLDME